MIFPDDIMKAVEKKYRLKAGTLLSVDKRKTVSDARSIAMYLTRKLTDLSLKEIAWWFERKDHTTIIHSCNKIRDRMENDPKGNISMTTKDLIDIIGVKN